MKASVATHSLFWLWFPLALSFTLMMAEAPTTNAVLARFDDPAVQLAGFGVALGLSLLIESPVIMLLATAIALVKGRDSFYALVRFVLMLMTGLTLLTALVAFTPLYDGIAFRLLGLPARVGEAGRSALQVMLLWSAAIGWRRFLQGVLMRYGGAHFVSWGTAIRLLSIVSVGVALLAWGVLPGAVVGACMVMAGVIVEALVTTLFALPILRERVLPVADTEPVPSQRAIARFHAPLAGTSLLTLLVQPLTASAIARLPEPEIALASWSVVFGSLLILRSWGLALQEATVAFLPDCQNPSLLQRFVHRVAWATSGVLLIALLTPLADWFLQGLLALKADLALPVRVGLWLCIGLPALTAYGSYLRGVLIYQRRTGLVSKGMALNIAVNALALGVGVLVGRYFAEGGALVGLSVGCFAFQLAGLVELGYLGRQIKTDTASPL